MNRKKGMMLSEVPFRNFPVLLKDCGFDFMIVDTEHGGFDYADLSGLLMTARLVSLDCIVRLPDNTRRDITRMADMGAKGFLLPMTDSAEQIAKAVEYAKYAPVGKRGISTMRAHTLYHPPKLDAYREAANAFTEIYAQIETKAGLDRIEEILAVRGVTGCLMGPNDLTCDLWFPPDAHAVIEGEIARLSECAARSGKYAGIITSDDGYLSAAKRAGMTHFCVGSELSMLKDAALRTIEKIEK